MPTPIIIAKKLAQKAGNAIMKYYGKVAVSYKRTGFGVGSVVTKADIEAERIIVKGIKKNFPKHGIYAEEETNFNLDSEYVWYIDPLDGTANFARSCPLFGVSIGLLRKGVPVLGVIYLPTLSLLVYAEKSKGAFANGKKIHVSSRPLEKSLYFTKGSSHGEPHIRKSLLPPTVATIKLFDASAYELAQIARGNGEIYIGINSLHDVAAGILIVEEAGGKVTDVKGNLWTVESKQVVVTNGLIHTKVIGLLNK